MIHAHTLETIETIYTYNVISDSGDETHGSQEIVTKKGKETEKKHD